MLYYVVHGEYDLGVCIAVRCFVYTVIYDCGCGSITDLFQPLTRGVIG